MIPILIFAFLLSFYSFFLLRISKGLGIVSKKKYDISNINFISVIIPFRNEEDNILDCLTSVCNQSLEKNKYEIIFIDDNSDDNTFNLLQNAEKPDNVIILKSPINLEDRGHKKKALNFAIERAKGEIIITTDADCTHAREWLDVMVSSFDERTGFVSGPVKFSSRGGLFDELQKIEFSSLILVGAGLIGIKWPIICNAANLGFRKSVFNKVGGYADNINLSSGDDEFLMQKIARETDYKINFCFNNKSMTTTKPNEKFVQFYQQRKRWASKGFYYRDKLIVFTLILIFLFYIGLPVQLYLAITLSKIYFITLAISLVIKFSIEYKIVQIDSRNLFSKTSNIYFIVAQFLHIPYILISGLAGIFGNYKWKGRKISR